MFIVCGGFLFNCVVVLCVFLCLKKTTKNKQTKNNSQIYLLSLCFMNFQHLIFFFKTQQHNVCTCVLEAFVFVVFVFFVFCFLLNCCWLIFLGWLFWFLKDYV